MIVVSDTSPIFALQAIGQLDILERLFEEVTVPQAVYDELAAKSESLPISDSYLQKPWIKKRQVANFTLAASLRGKLDEGEAEAISLALELEIKSILIDEREGRKTAAALGLEPIGLLGILLAARRLDIIPGLKPVLDQLIFKAGFWVSDRLYQEIRLRAGE